MLENAVDCVARGILYGRKLAAWQEKAGWNPGKLAIADLPDAKDRTVAIHDEPVFFYPCRDIALIAVVGGSDEAKQQSHEKVFGRPIASGDVFSNMTHS